jgi:hypothetical protein
LQKYKNVKPLQASAKIKSNINKIRLNYDSIN